jgi:hypothetical protein
VHIHEQTHIAQAVDTIVLVLCDECTYVHGSTSLHGGSQTQEIIVSDPTAVLVTLFR